HRPLRLILRFAALERHLCGLALAIADVAYLLFHDLRQNFFERAIARAEKFLQLIASDSVDQKAENREVLPRLDDAAECVEIPLLIGLAQHGRYVDAHIAGYARDLAEVVDLLGRRPGDDQLVGLARRVGQNVFYIKMWAADLAVRLDRQHATEQLAVLRVHFFQVFQAYFVPKHGASYFL